MCRPCCVQLTPADAAAACAPQACEPGCSGVCSCGRRPDGVRCALQRGVLIAGDDFKSGQTKLKSVLVDFLVGAGLKPTSIVSYNHLGNNDGMNLSAPQTFRSKARPGRVCRLRRVHPRRRAARA